jgi:hypothetical protein
MNWVSRVIIGVFLAVGLFTFAGIADAHQSGCHRWHSCPSDSGSYTCGDLGYACQYSTYSSYSQGSYYYQGLYYSQSSYTPVCPQNAYSIGSSCYCNFGYIASGNKCTLKTITYSSYYPTASYSNLSCPAHSSESSDDSSKCTCDTGYKVSKDKSKCIKITAKENDKICRADFGLRSKWDKTYNEEDKTINCVCKTNYEWNTQRTSCIKED